MDYYLQVSAIGHQKKLPISVDEFKSLKEAQEKLNDLFKFTENYCVVVESYRKVEMTKFEVELNHILYGIPDYVDFSNVRIALNSPISGYLSSARYFLDSTPKILHRLFSDNEYDQFDQFRKGIYDSNFGYRFIEALRNHVQHNELPIHIVMFHNFLEP